jgi:lipoprotein-anchoring transpeptidase ErfK/SrfK
MRLVLALAVLAVAPASAAAQTPTPTPTPEPEPVIPAGATAAGLDIGGLTVTEAAAALDAAFAARLARGVRVRVAGHRSRLRPHRIGFAFEPLRTARRALAVALRTPPEPDGTRPVDVRVRVSYDGDALRAFSAGVDRRSRVRPRNARVRMTVRRMKLRRARAGRSIDEKALTRTLRVILRDPHARRFVRARRLRVHPKVTVRDLRRRHRTVVTIDRRHFRLRLFKKLRRRKTYRIAVGAPGYPTPRGRFSITNKARNPAWSAPDRPWAGAYRNEVVPGGSPENPLKARWLGIVGGVGIHGTADEASIGTRASHGCIRMRVPDVKDLYRRVPVGATVLIR